MFFLFSSFRKDKKFIFWRSNKSIQTKNYLFGMVKKCLIEFKMQIVLNLNAKSENLRFHIPYLSINMK